jgi:hypothetical protein
MKIEDLFVPYDIAKLLWDKGCKLKAYFGGWDDNQKWYWHPDSDITLDAPTYQQVVDWFREKHNIIVEIWFSPEETDGFIWLYEIYNKGKETEAHGNYFNNYYEALTEAIKHALTLIP